MTTEDLKDRWRSLWRRMSVAEDKIPDAGPLLAAYEGPGRHYHNLYHIADCLNIFDDVREFSERPESAELAIWLHDLVYDPTRRDNEERSAELARNMIHEAGLSSEFAEDVARIVLATKHDAPTTDPDAWLVSDIDLSILGREPKEFDAYESAIRLEYSHVPEPDFRAGRAKILSAFIRRPHIYATTFFQVTCEKCARENLTRSLAMLGN